MSPDARIDRATVGDDLDLPVLMWDRLLWDDEAVAHGDTAVVLRALPEAQRALLVLEQVQGEIFNGGVAQCLDNAGDLLPDAVAGARTVGALEHAALFEELDAALPALPGSVSGRADALQDLLEQDGRLEDRLAELEERFYELDAAGSLLDQVLEYVGEHPDEFFLSEQEALADTDDFVARAVAAVGPVERATAGAVAAAEATLGRRFPALLARLHLDVGAGGWGPAGGFLTPGEVVGTWAWARREVRGPATGDVWPDSLLPIVAGPEHEWYCIDAGEPHLPVMRLPGSGPRSWSNGHPILPQESAATLRGWLEAWLRRARAQPSTGVDGNVS